MKKFVKVNNVNNKKMMQYPKQQEYLEPVLDLTKSSSRLYIMHYLTNKMMIQNIHSGEWLVQMDYRVQGFAID
ncbi:MAG: hypothetical protein ACTHKK_04205 [Candidatus Nitrosocosmicus sp.]